MDCENDINELYDKVDNIIIDYKTYFWKNGWQHEGDRESKDYSIKACEL